MRIDEIVSPTEKLSQVSQSYDLEKMKAQRSDAISAYPPKPSAGYYSQGYQTTDPFTYGKIAHVPTNLDKDPYYQYVRAISPIMESNPYVPRIYDIKLYRDKQGYIIPDYTMEKLVPGKTLPKKIIYGMGERMFGSNMWFYFKKSSMDSMINYEDFDSQSLWRKLASLLDISIQTYPANPYDHIDLKNYDPNLLQVIKLIKMLIIRIPDTESDVHSNNIMVRMGRIPQVVLSDPISIEGTMDPVQH